MVDPVIGHCPSHHILLDVQDRRHYEGLGLLRRHWESQVGSKGFNNVMQLASSGFGDSDSDIFFHSLTPAQATHKLKRLLTKLHNNSVLKHAGVSVGWCQGCAVNTGVDCDWALTDPVCAVAVLPVESRDA